MNALQAMDSLIAGGRVMDPAAGHDEVRDLYIVDGRISDAPPVGSDCLRLDASGWIVVPGLVDLHTHLREPGDTAAETVATGTAAAARGGFTKVVAMPNTRPPLDTPERMRDFMRRVAEDALVSVLPCGCLTQARAGMAAADLTGLKQAGAIAFSDDGDTPLDERLFTGIAATAQSLELPILDHAEDKRCSAGGVMHAGARSRGLGLPGIPEEAELLAVDRDIRIASQTGCAMHIQHVSCAPSVERIRKARDRGIPVSAEVTPHHLAFCDTDVSISDSRYKMNPPLREVRDRIALRQAVIDGTISVLATDHAPHTEAAKAKGFLDAPFGVVGLETALAVTYTLLVCDAGMPLLAWLRRWTTGPTRVLGLPPPRMAPGERADVLVFDPRARRTIDAATFRSRSANSPFTGLVYNGQTMLTLCGGRMVWLDDDAARRIQRGS